MRKAGSAPSGLLLAVLSLGLLLGLVAVIALGAGAMRLTFPLLYARSGLRPALVGSELALMAPVLLAAALLAAVLPASWRPDLGWRGVAGRVAGLSLAAGVAFWVASAGLLELQPAVWAPPPGYLEAFRQIHAALRPAGPLDAAFSVLAIALAPAACEEMVFRGVALPFLQRLGGPAFAVGGSALLFAAVHLPDWYRFPFALLVGVGLGLLRVFSGSVVSSFLAHGLLNTVTFAVAPLLDDPTEVVPEPHLLLGLALLAAGVAASALILRKIRASAGQERGQP
jgi:membrane protease YdiL (CAAX protease family)